MEELAPITADLPPLETIIDLVFYALLGLFAVFTAIIYYHWTTYATDKAVSRITLVAYLVCTLPLLLLMGAIVLIV